MDTIASDSRCNRLGSPFYPRSVTVRGSSIAGRSTIHQSYVNLPPSLLLGGSTNKGKPPKTHHSFTVRRSRRSALCSISNADGDGLIDVVQYPLPHLN
ncbi:hypothetical protein PROFUN_00873 [Planoprotostelium fungivorum]|uniref:Uncharacterized protein n=1 Tax=Planoprotostelium fungivorum TaxID=1890364 RepID=A0A2P6P099_9EUKA|nr:hypothetical protein PROFUN_00873 [Planoprotostelium fungivorum]